MVRLNNYNKHEVFLFFFSHQTVKGNQKKKFNIQSCSQKFKNPRIGYLLLSALVP